MSDSIENSNSVAETADGTDSLTTLSPEHVDVKQQNYLNEIKDLKNQLDEVRTKLLIVETTKQDEVDEVKFRSKQEIDSLNHIINALQGDLNVIRSDYEQLNTSNKELKKQNLHLINQMNSGASAGGSGNNNTSGISNLDLIKSPSSKNNNNSSNSGNTSLNQDNEDLEEDMRKAKKDADMLRSLVMPLETEITELKARSDSTDKRIVELERIIEEKNKELNQIKEDEKKAIEELQSYPDAESDSGYVKKYALLKQYLKKSEEKFVQLEQTNLKAIKQLYSLLTGEQKLRLLPSRPKSKSASSASTTSSAKSGVDKSSVVATSTEKTEDHHQPDGFVFEQNEAITKMEELLEYLTSYSLTVTQINEEGGSVLSQSTDTHSLNSSYMLVNTQQHTTTASQPFSISQMPNHSYAELLAMYEKERNTRLDLESSFTEKAKESNRQIENLNREISNLAAIINELSRQYETLQQQYKFQLEQLIKLNEELRHDLKAIEAKCEHLKQENLKLKVENKQFYGEQTALIKDLDEQYHPTVSMSQEELVRQLSQLKQDLVKLMLANQALNKQHTHSLEKIKHLQRINEQLDRATNSSDQVAIRQSLESELERERKVRMEAEDESKEFKGQLLMIREKGQHLVESLRAQIDQNEFEIKRFKEENQEMSNQIQSLKLEAKNSLSVQEDLVRLIQSLQIELNQVKSSHVNSSGSGDGISSLIQVRCQNEDDFSECAACNQTFTVTRRKKRCSHCCKIFCGDCLAKSVLSGPNRRPHKVCDTCHTLLDKHTSPGSST